jgi:hypothetical protein
MTIFSKLNSSFHWKILDAFWTFVFNSLHHCLENSITINGKTETDSLLLKTLEMRQDCSHDFSHKKGGRGHKCHMYLQQVVKIQTLIVIVQMEFWLLTVSVLLLCRQTDTSVYFHTILTITYNRCNNYLKIQFCQFFFSTGL